jgi:hypothetical protein
MAKQKKRVIHTPPPPPPDPPSSEQIDPIEEIEHIEPGKPRRFSPDPCPMCITDRPPGSNFSRVYGRDGRVRYIKCDFCRHRYKQMGP